MIKMVTFLRSRSRLAATASTATTAAANPPAMDLDLPVDPNEPTYCLCNQVSYGEMVACDNPDVSVVVKVTKWAGLVTGQNGRVYYWMKQFA